MPLVQVLTASLAIKFIAIAMLPVSAQGRPAQPPPARFSAAFKTGMIPDGAFSQPGPKAVRHRLGARPHDTSGVTPLAHF